MVGHPVGVFTVARHDQRVGVLLHRDHGPDDGQFVPHFGLQREVFADLHAGDIRRDGLELATELFWSVRLEIVCIQVGRPTRQVDHDGRLEGERSAGGPGLE